MAKGNKFGTFGGVFTPSVLTVLGVIMYLRLPWIVGHGGLWLALGIIAAAHFISITTGLSVSSIATDKRVEAGGSYYIVSRTMGLAIGGTLGLAEFAALSFSISLYIIGFAESFLGTMGWEQSLTNLRICGMISLVGITAITFASTTLAMRAQYLILALTVISLASIFAGTPEPASEGPHLLPFAGGEAAPVLFGIFFPAVTGFTAGVSMSGDLKDPKKSIPRGTVGAILTGLVIYIALAIYLAMKVPAEDLRNNTAILLDIAWSPQVVLAGIWGATLSSALGSILAAPRILQALSLDHITPRIFGLGQGPTNEPRYALLLAFAISAMGILIGELDAIARVVAVLFIATYGFLNLSASFEMIASPDFRPDFRIPRWVPVLGAATCAVLMIWLDLVALLGAVVMMSGLFLYLKRKELQLATGDAWLGIWSSLVRVGLAKLATEQLHQRNWRPNILLFTRPDEASRAGLIAFSNALSRHRGVTTELLLTQALDEEDFAGASVLLEEDEAPSPPSADTPEEPAPEPSPSGFFQRTVAARDPYEAMAAASQFHGFAGLEPNTVLVDWQDQARAPEDFAAYLALIARLDRNVMALAYDEARGFGAYRHIDLWWSAKAGSLDLNLALMRFITIAEEWRQAELRFFVINEDPALTDALHRATTQALAEGRIKGMVKVVNNATDHRPHEDWITQYSANTDLVVIGLPNEPITPDDVERHTLLTRTLGTVLLVRPSSQFAGGFGQLTASTVTRDQAEDPTGDRRIRLPRIRLPETPDLAAPARLFSEKHTTLAMDFCERSLRQAFSTRALLLTSLHEAIDAQYHEFEASFQGAGSRRLARTLRRGPEALLRRTHDALQTFEEGELQRTLASAEAGIADLLQGLSELEEALPRRLLITRLIEDFAPDPDDTRALRRFKRNRRLAARLLRRPPRYRLRPRPLFQYYLRHRIPVAARDALRDVAAHTNLMAEDLGRFFNVLKDSLAAIERRHREETLDAAFLTEERARVLSELERLQAVHHETGERQMALIMLTARSIEQELANDLDRLDAAWLTRWRTGPRRLPAASKEITAELQGLPQVWTDHQALFLRRAALAPLMATVQSRLGAAINEATEALQELLDGGVIRRCQALHSELTAYREALDAPDPDGPPELLPEPLRGGRDENQIVGELHQALHAATSHVPEDLTLLREASLQALAADPFAPVETETIGLRRQLQFLIDVELVAPIQELLAQVPMAEERATSVAEDVVRLITFARTDTEGSDPDPMGASLAPVIDNGLERLESELSRLRELESELIQQIAERLERVMDLTDGFARLGTAEAFEAHGRRGPDQLTRLGRMTERARSEVKRALVQLAYRRSAGTLFAQRLGETEEPSVDRLHQMVEACTPRREVLSALPFYYSQLFMGQSAVHSAFWVGRDREVQQIERAIARYDRGAAGSILITGDPGSGKTALFEVAIERFLQGRQVVRISPPTGGSTSLADFRKAMQQELRRKGSIRAMVDGLREGSVVVLYDTEMWWERSSDGFEVLQTISQLVQRYGHRVLFLIELGLPAYRLLQHLTPLTQQAVGTVQCGPVDAEALKDIVMLRHNSTGLRFALDGRPQSEVSEWALAQLFTAHFAHSGGNIGGALASWVAHAERLEGEVLHLSVPQPLDADGLYGIAEEPMALLLQLALHKEMTVARLHQVSGLDRGLIHRDLATLRRMGLLTRGRRDVIRLAPGPQHLVTQALRTRGMMP